MTKLLTEFLQKTVDDPIATFTGLLVLVTGGLIWVGWRQARLSKNHVEPAIVSVLRAARGGKLAAPAGIPEAGRAGTRSLTIYIPAMCGRVILAPGKRSAELDGILERRRDVRRVEVAGDSGQVADASDNCASSSRPT